MTVQPTVRGGSISRGHELRTLLGVGQFLVAAEGQFKMATDTLITSNLAFSEWNRVFGDDKLTAALLDRLAQHADVLVTRGQGDRGGNAHKRMEPEEELAPISP